MASKSGKSSRKKYCDRNFKQQLAKALRANCGEPENFDKIKSNKLLAKYRGEKIKEYTHNVARDMQKRIEQSIKDPRTKELFTAANVLDDISGEDKPQELPLLLKLNSSAITQGSLKSNEVNFGALNKFLCSAVSGSLDHVEMNDVTKALLHETYSNLMSQVEEDAPTVLSQLNSASGGPLDPNIKNLLDLMQDGSLNPFNIPTKCILKNKHL